MQTRDILQKLPFRIILIFYMHGFRGHAVTRILSCHPEAHWDPAWSSVQYDRNDPLSFPESYSGFDFEDTQGFTIKKASTLVHTGAFLDIDMKDVSVRSSFSKVYNLMNLIKDKKSKKYIFLNTHPFHKALGFETIKRPKKVILYSESQTDPRYDLWSDTQLHSLTPQEDALNINIDALFSTDYKLFEEEYLKAVRYFDFTIRINAVRAFILRYLERERYAFTS